ncbi:hypothetical protein H8E77_25780 [bacterium]|nr:hypothetical protein [bacterium]
MRSVFSMFCLVIFLCWPQIAFAQSSEEIIQQRINTLQAEIDSMRYWGANQDLASKPTIYWTLNGLIVGGSHVLFGLGGFYQGYLGTTAAFQNWEKQPGATVALGVSLFSLANSGLAAYSLAKALDKKLDVDKRNRHLRYFWISVAAETILLPTLYTILSIHDHRLVKVKVRKQAEIQLLQEQLRRLNFGFRPNSGGLVFLYRATF